MTITILAVGFLCCACFLIGARVGQSASKGEKIEVPNLNPIKAVREHQERREAKKQLDKAETILHNVEVYDGTGYGQKDVPR